MFSRLTRPQLLQQRAPRTIQSFLRVTLSTFKDKDHVFKGQQISHKVYRERRLYRASTLHCGSKDQDSSVDMPEGEKKECMSIEKVAAMRMDYGDQNLHEDSLPSLEPINIFDAWFKEATNTEGIGEPNAMTLATSSRDGKPSARVVLLKGYDRTGFRFFTNYESQKGKDLTENPYACLVFYWEVLHKQIRINGAVERMSEEESTKYFHSRPRCSQIGALVSHQSQVIKSREVLSNREKELQEMYKDENISIPKPAYWGGYLVKPYSMEFWCGKSGRLHDRIHFRKLKDGEAPPNDDITKIGEDGWIYERLSP